MKKRDTVKVVGKSLKKIKCGERSRRKIIPVKVYEQLHDVQK
jgi:hypothetical protein